jgi:hypothetical protein
MSDKLPMLAGGSVKAIIPQSFEDCYRLAQIIVASGMAPKDMGTPEKVTIAIMHGLEIGMTPLAALQRIAVINGRPTIWGDAAIGLVRASGKCKYVREWLDGETAYCETHRTGEAQSVCRSFSIDDAKTAKLWGKQGPWQQFPDRMLQMRARAFCLRDVYADILGGMSLREELEDNMRDVTPSQPPPPPNDREIRSKHLIEEAVTEAERNAIAEVEAEAIYAGPEPLADIPVADIFDPDIYLDNLAGMMAVAEDLATLDEVWGEHMATGEELLYTPDRERANKIYAASASRLLKKKK